jgi:hypothetical protein
MALQRSDKTVITAESVSADYDDIVAFQVDLVNKSIAITVGSGNLVDGKFVPETRNNFIIQDKPETSVYKEETLSIVNNKITLTEAPVDGQMVLFTQSSVKDYTVNVKEVTFNDEDEITGLTEIKVGYGYIVAADPVFSLMAAQTADGDKSIYLNLKKLMWDKLIELGHVSGTIV